MNPSFWHGKRVFVTGHTGFKGGWLCLWLQAMGAKVYGFALEAPTTPHLYGVAQVAESLTGNTCADVRDASAFTRAMQAAQPDVVFHLAAQSLVRYSYTAPVETYSVNVMGTVNLLEAARQTASVKAVVNVTTDKCYENHEGDRPYREDEAMGGFDPYSSSKGCSELVTAAYRRSFLDATSVYVASARAGNVIGGGDWAVDRLIPDFFRALNAEKTLMIRSPQATRPWQHVLEPLSGYLTLAENLYTDGQGFAQAWNFGPDENDARPVRWIVEYLCSKVHGAIWQLDAYLQPHEANYLKLDSSKARVQLDWRPRWDLKIALDKTLAWHQSWRQGLNMKDFSLQQIREYESTASGA